MKIIYKEDIDYQNCKVNIKNLLNEISYKPEGKSYVYNLIKEFAINNYSLYINSNLVDLLNRIYREERGEIFSQGNSNFDLLEMK